MTEKLRRQRLRKTWDFQKILKERQKIHNKNYIIFYRKNFKQVDLYRFGISIPQKIVRKVVLRNKYKRQIKYILFKLQCERVKQSFNLKGYDFLVIIKERFVTENFQTKQKSLENLFDFFVWKINSKKVNISVS